MKTGPASNTCRGSDIIVQIEAGGFYSRKYGTYLTITALCHSVCLIQTAVTYIIRGLGTIRTSPQIESDYGLSNIGDSDDFDRPVASLLN